MSEYTVIGLMSGTSLDGLDLVSCTFTREDGRWKYQVQSAMTIPYEDEWRRRLKEAGAGSAFDYVKTDVEFGHYLGVTTMAFIRDQHLFPDFIASHGHTVFHQPEKRITSQIGRGSAIAAETGLPVICDFRSLDVALGGQGAPLVPIGDKMLFSEYTSCLNIGGFANISCDRNGSRIAFDIAPANIVLNHLAEKAGYRFDANGELASAGTVRNDLLEVLNNLPYYCKQPPKSLGKEWVVHHVLPLLESSRWSLNDQLATFCEHVAIQISNAGQGTAADRMLVTGGGAFNTFLVERMKEHVRSTIVIPDEVTVNFKEAIVFAFLGLLRWSKENNCLMSVTGASRDASGGAIY